MPLSLSTSGGALIAGLVCGYLRSVNRDLRAHSGAGALGLQQHGTTIFIAVVGISTGPGFIKGLQEAGISLFLWGIFVTLLPFIIGIYAGKYIFKIPPAASCSAPVPAPVPRPRRWARSRKRRRARSPRSAIPSPMLWATRS